MECRRLGAFRATSGPAATLEVDQGDILYGTVALDRARHALRLGTKSAVDKLNEVRDSQRGSCKGLGMAIRYIVNTHLLFFENFSPRTW